jgi:hypothetical protein
MSLMLIGANGDGGDLCTLRGLEELRRAAGRRERTLEFLTKGTITDETWRKSVLKEIGGEQEFLEMARMLKACKAPIVLTDGVVEDREDDMEQNRTTETLVMRLARNRCGARSRARLEPGAVENDGTSEGVRKAWQKRKAGGEGRTSVWDAMTPAQRIRARSQDRQEAKKSAEKSRWTSRNSTMLEQASPSPMIGEYAEGKARRSVLADKLAAKNAAFGSKYEEAKHPRYKGKWKKKSTLMESEPEKKHGMSVEEAREYLKERSKEGVFGLTWAQIQQMQGGRLKNRTASFNAEQLAIGTKHEMEHTKDPKVARKIAADHLGEDPDYYRKLKKCMGD